MIEKTLCGTINDVAVKLVTTMSVQSLEKVRQVKSQFERFNCPQSKEVAAWARCAEYHFNVLSAWSIFKLNGFDFSEIFHD